MKRRQNFLLGRTATYEVRVYPYGKKNVRDDRNVKVRKFSSVKAATDWAKVNLDYPEVEVVDMAMGRVIFSGGTGKTFNPRKKRKTPKRRDVYAEMAKARKTTKGHTRKDRKRSVARGSSRKPKHKIRLNPFEYEKPNLGAKAFDAAVKKRQAKILGMYRGFLAALDSAGAKKLPSAGEIRDDAMQGAVIIESTRYPELRSQSKEVKGPKVVAAEVLGVGPGGAFAAYVQTYPEIFELHLKDTVEVLRKERKKLRTSEREDAKRIEKAKEDYAQERGTKKAEKIEQIEAQIEATRAELEEYEDEDEGELDPRTAAELAEVYEMTPGEEAEEEQLQEVDQRKKAVKKARKKRKKTVEYEEGEYVPPTEGFSKEKMDRLGKYWQHLSPVRRTDVQPPLNLLGKTRQDVLLYVLKDGTTQVWVKGSMTVTFEPSGKLPSWTIAHRYANRWRGLSPSGSVRGPQKEGDPPVKKSRLRTGVYAAVEGQDKLKKLEDPINIVEKRDRKLKRKKYDMPDLDTYELIGDRANPRPLGDMRNWTDAELRKAVKSGPDLSDTAWRQSTNMADHLRAAAKYELERRKREKNARAVRTFLDLSLDGKKLYALRLGKWYSLSMPRSRRLFGPEAMEGFSGGDISTDLPLDEWKFLLPKEVPWRGGWGGDRANPRRRKNSKMTEVYFFIDHEYDSKRYKYVERLFARRDGQDYRVALTRIKEMFGEGPKGMHDTSTMLSDSDWRYLRPVEAELESTTDETTHYRNPRRRKNPRRRR